MEQHQCHWTESGHQCPAQAEWRSDVMLSGRKPSQRGKVHTTYWCAKHKKMLINEGGCSEYGWLPVQHETQ